MQSHPLRTWVSGADPRTLALAAGAFIALVGALIGLLLAVIGPLYTIGVLVALAGGVWALSRLEYALWAVIAVVAVLPFATLPFKIVLTPTFLDLAMGAAFFLYLSQWMTGERRRLAITPVHPLIVLFILLSVFSFAAGLRYAGLTSNVLRKFAELVLSMIFALVLVDVVRSYRTLRQLVMVIILAGTAAALLGIAFWLMPDQLAERGLARLAVIGYPDGGVIQYIEQNPELPERAIGTSVNPNSLGGLLVMVAALAAPQLMTHFPVTGRRWHAIPVLLALTVCLILTFSRGSMLALAVAVVFIASLRYRRVLLIGLLGGLALILLPWSQAYVDRFVAGFQLADLATQMRLGEYGDAITLISRYPLLGVGFSGAPDIDVYLGVANVYLTIAENMGLLGLAAFVILTGAIFAYAWRARPFLNRYPGMAAIWLGLLAGLIGALVGGVFDHYFFNLEFHHAITIYWTFIGLVLATARLAQQDPPATRIDPPRPAPELR